MASVQCLRLFAADDAAFNAQRRAGRDGAQEIDFHVTGHGGEAAGANGLAHGLVKQSGNDAAVQVAGMALEGFWDRVEG